MVESISVAIDRIDARLEGIAKEIPAVQLLLAVPGVGPITALAFYAVVGDPTRFANIRNVGAYLGMVVRRDQLHWRWIVERTFGWTGRYRRMSKDYEHETSSSAAWMLIGMTRLMAARVAGGP